MFDARDFSILTPIDSSFTDVVCIDTHTAGQPTRIVVSGLSEIVGNSMRQKLEFITTHYDHFRKLLMREPRGHDNMFGAFLTKPMDSSSHYSAIFFDNDGFLPMCGHGSIGIAVMLLKLKKIKITPPQTKVCLNTIAGKITLFAHTPDNETVLDITLQGIPSFAYKINQYLPFKNFHGLSEIAYDIGFSGNFVITVDVEQLNLKINTNSLSRLKELGLNIFKKINNEIEIVHPQDSQIKQAQLIMFYEKINNTFYKNLTIFGHGQVDRSPCGTGTCARMSILTDKGALKINQPIENQSITGERFIRWLERSDSIAQIQYYTPFIKSRAYLTGINRFILEHADPFQQGFSL